MIALLFAAFGGLQSELEAPPRADWIWSGPVARDGERAWFRRVFAADGPADARLFATADNHLEVWLGGELVASSDEWTTPVELDLGPALRPGRNVLAVAARNDGGAAGLLLELSWTDAAGRRRRVATGDGWRATGDQERGWSDPTFDDGAWPAAATLGALGCAPWGDLGTGARAQPQGAPSGDTIVVPPGFTCELVHSVPRDTQGSWVALAADDGGRFFASDQYGALWRVTPHGSGAPLVERVAVELGGAHGLLWARGSLYAVVAEGEREHGLWRARDTDGDGALDASELLLPLRGGGEHGPHAVVLGPDGESLWLALGNHTEPPRAPSRALHAAEDQLLPRLDDPNGHAVGRLAPGGTIVRTDLDGRGAEIVAIGLRNAYDLAFDARGEAFTFDSDMEWDVGLPWYRPTRVLHVVSGADWGWRHGSGKWSARWPDTLPAACELGVGSPTGVTFGTRTRFPARWRRALFAADWAYGRLWAVHLEPDGASFRGRAELFASGTPFPITDLAVGADGALWVTTGGRNVQSGLYRIAWVGSASVGEERDGGGAEPTPADALALRGELEALHRPGAPGQLGDLWRHLDSADRFVRHAARVALEHRDAAEWAERALAETRPRAAIEALLALVRAQPELHADRVVARVAALPLETYDDDRRAGALRVLAVALARGGRPSAALAARLAELGARGDGALERELCALLVHLGEPSAVPRALERLERAATQEERLGYAFTLRNARAGWTSDALRRFAAWLAQARSTYRGGASFRAYLDAIDADLEANVGAPWTRARAAVAAPAVATAAGAAHFVRAWTFEELERELGALRAGRDFERGRDAFERAACGACHRIAGEGGSHGPDLTGAGGRFAPRDLLEAIARPSSVISDQYRDTLVTTADGELLAGRIERDDADALVLRLASPPDRRVELHPDEIAEREPSPLSSMPEGLLNVLERDEILDLLSYVLAGGDRAQPAFGRRVRREL